MTCSFIEEKKNVIITGPCGCGKTWIACCIATRALAQLKTVRFYSASKLVIKLKGMNAETYLKTLDQMAKLDLLILDDIGMMDLDLQSCRIFFEVLDSMEHNGSIIFMSQYPVKNWYSLFEKATSLTLLCLVQPERQKGWKSKERISENFKKCGWL